MNDWVRRSSAGKGEILRQLIIWFAIFGLGQSMRAQIGPTTENPVAMDQSHESGSRWKPDFFGHSDRPWVALLWFRRLRGDSEVMETQLFKRGDLSITSGLLANGDIPRVDRRALEQITNILSSLPDSTPSVPFQEQIRVSWGERGAWMTRVYSRANPPRAVVDLHRAMQIQFFFPVPELQLLQGGYSEVLTNSTASFDGAVGGDGLVISRSDTKTVRIQIPEKPVASAYNITNYPQGEPFTNRYLSISEFSLSADGSKAAYEKDEEIYLIDLQTGKLLWKRKPRLDPKLMKLSPDGTRLLVYDEDDLDLYDTSSEKAPQHLIPERVEVQAIDFSPDGRLIAWGSRPTVNICDLSGAVMQNLIYRDGVLSLAFSPDSTKLAVTPWGRGIVMIHEVTSGKLMNGVPYWGFIFPNVGPNELQWSPGGKFLAVRYPSGPLIIADVEQARPVAILKEPLVCMPAFNKTETGILAVGERPREIHFLELPGKTRN